jgi:hypothetical protein
MTAALFKIANDDGLKWLNGDIRRAIPKTAAMLCGILNPTSGV